MVLQKDLRHLTKKLLSQQLADVVWNGSSIVARLGHDNQRLSLTTAIYQGDQFIPKSVRQAITHRLHTSHIRTYLTLDEGQYQIYLHYLGRADDLHEGSLAPLLEEFTLVAERWRSFLNDREEKDLVYIPVK